jgi:hypothetical protein
MGVFLYHNEKILTFLAFTRGLVWYLDLVEETINMNSNDKMNNKPSNTVKDPEEWKTGNEEMTGAQRSYLHTLADEAGEDVSEDLTKAEASKKIDELQDKTGRGINH